MVPRERDLDFPQIMNGTATAMTQRLVLAWDTTPHILAQITAQETTVTMAFRVAPSTVRFCLKDFFGDDRLIHNNL